MTMDNGMDYKKMVRQKTAKPLMWIGMASIVMFFGGLTSAVIVEYGKGTWAGFELPIEFWLSTAVIVLSSVAFVWSINQAKKDRLPQLKAGLSATLFLGLGFMVLQLLGWANLTAQGLFFTGPGHETSSSYFFVLTWAHFAHAIGGIVSLIWILVKANRNKYDSKNLLGLQVSATYWHFLGGLWIYLFVFLNYINQNF